VKLSTSWIRSSSSQLGRKLFWPKRLRSVDGALRDGGGVRRPWPLLEGVLDEGLVEGVLGDDRVEGEDQRIEGVALNALLDRPVLEKVEV